MIAGAHGIIGLCPLVWIGCHWRWRQPRDQAHKIPAWEVNVAVRCWRRERTICTILVLGGREDLHIVVVAPIVVQHIVVQHIAVLTSNALGLLQKRLPCCCADPIKSVRHYLGLGPLDGRRATKHHRPDVDLLPEMVEVLLLVVQGQQPTFHLLLPLLFLLLFLLMARLLLLPFLLVVGLCPIQHQLP